jgi:septal ring factor EnvC (AmiA/AmiB activator)
MTNEDIKRFNENQRKLVEKIKELQREVSALDLKVSASIAGNKNVMRELSGLQTALIGANVLTKEGLELHCSFNLPGEEEEEPEIKKV